MNKTKKMYLFLNKNIADKLGVSYEQAVDLFMALYREMKEQAIAYRISYEDALNLAELMEGKPLPEGYREHLKLVWEEDAGEVRVTWKATRKYPENGGAYIAMLLRTCETEEEKFTKLMEIIHHPNFIAEK
jgi:hypothetical protein